MGLRYHGSKGVRAYRQEDGVIGNLAATCHLEESASHHIGTFVLMQVCRCCDVVPEGHLAKVAVVSAIENEHSTQEAEALHAKG